MARGRPRKLSQLKKLDGQTSHKPMFDESGIEGLGEPFTPEHLMDDARGIIEVVKKSMPPSVYSALDSMILSAYAVAWAHHKRAVIETCDPNFQHIVTNSSGSLVLNPWLKQTDKQAMLMASLGEKLGLDPRSRQAMKLPTAQQHKSKFEGLTGKYHDEPPESYNTLNN